jgi:biopolymer transport protein ExbB/TolQ
MNQQVATRVNTIAVNAYKVLGTVLLFLILLGFITYLSLQGFFLLSRGWVAPTVISPTDPQILQLSAQIAQHATARDKLLAERRELRIRLADAERILTVEQDFQERFQLALRGERASRERLLRRLSSLRSEYQRTRQEIEESNRAFSGLARVRTEALYGARLLDQEAHLTTNHQLAQMAQSNLTLAERAVELETRREALKRELQSLAALRGGRGGKAGRMTPELLLLEREYTRSVLEHARTEATRGALQADLQALDEAAARYEKLLATIQGSPYLRAFQGNLTVAFVPYENVESARPGTALYACAAKLVWCRQVGVVGEVLEGEVSVKHPIRQHFLRGVMVELQLQDGPSAREELLHLGRPPLLL